MTGDSHRMPALALLAYLVSHHQPVSRELIRETLWGSSGAASGAGVVSPKTVSNTATRARQALGDDPGRPMLLTVSDRGYELSAAVTSDWQRFQILSAQARAAKSGPEAAELFGQALALVRGARSRGNATDSSILALSAEQVDYFIAARVVDVAEELAELAVGHSDWQLASDAAQKGMRLDPTREALYRAWMHALGRSGRSDRVPQVYQKLVTELRTHYDDAMTPADDTETVYRSYARRAGASPPARHRPTILPLATRWWAAPVAVTAACRASPHARASATATTTAAAADHCNGVDGPSSGWVPGVLLVRLVVMDSSGGRRYRPAHFERPGHTNQKPAISVVNELSKLERTDPRYTPGAHRFRARPGQPDADFLAN